MPGPVADIADRVEALLAPVVEPEGYSVLLCEFTGSTRRRILRLYIEKLDGTEVDIADCVAVNHLVTDLLDAEDVVPTAYNLEVSSPGVERPLKRVEHFEAQLGKEIRVKTWEPIDGRKVWRGLLLAVDDDVLTVQDSGQEFRIPVPAVDKANVVFVDSTKGEKKGGGSRRKRRGRR